MGNNIRIGKDFNVQWAINKVVDGERLPYDLVGKELQLYIVNDNGRKEVAGWKVQGNVIQWTYLGKDQRRLGAYQLILVENAGKEGMVTVDTCKAFNLVEHSCEENVDRGNDIVIKTVTLESYVALAPIVKEGGGEFYDEIKERLEEQDQLIEDLQNMKIDREADDYYPKLAVGLADNLAGVDVVDSEINYRRSGGGAISDGVARIESIKGNSVVWNQKNNLINIGIVKDNSGSSSLAYVNLGNANYYTSRLNGHKIFAKATPASANGIAEIYFTGNVQNNIIGGLFFTASTSVDVVIYAAIAAGANVNTTATIVFYDFTQMFGAGNEPTTIEEFYARIPMGVDMNAYNEGEVIHMDVQSIESQGVNAWDEEWESGNFDQGKPIEDASRIRSKNYIRIIGGKQYYSTMRMSFFFYDKDKNYISTDYDILTTAPANAFYMMFAAGSSGSPIVTYNHDICINLSDTAINGKYFPYIKRVEDLSIIRKYFPDGMKSAGSAHDEIRYNKASGKREKIEAICIRAYQDGDADNASYLTDGKVTCYPLAEPIVTELDEADQFKDLDIQVWNGGTEKANAEGKSAPLAADITYGFNAIGKIKELESLVAALRAKVGI